MKGKKKNNGKDFSHIEEGDTVTYLFEPGVALGFRVLVVHDPCNLLVEQTISKQLFLLVKDRDLGSALLPIQ